MMRYAFAVVMVVAALLAAGCKDSESPAQKTPSPAASTDAQLEPLAPVPEGVLLVQESNPIGYPTTFAIRESEALAITKGPLLSVAPDGRHLAAIEQDAAGDYRAMVRVIGADGKETFAHRGPEPGRDSMYPSVLWSRDGKQLAYTLPDEERLSTNRVYTVNADGSGRGQASENAGSYTLIGWTADGQLLVHDGANLISSDVGDETLPLPDGFAASYSFQMSPDGRAVAFTAGSDPEAQELWVLDTDSGESRLVAKTGPQARRPPAGLYVSAGAPPGAEAAAGPAAMMKGPPPVAWSPDGSRIAYYRSWTDEGATFRSELRVVDIETGEDVSVTEEGGWRASWSPDGRFLAEAESVHSRVVLLAPGGDVRTLDVPANRVLWSPTGRLIAIGSGVRLVDPETGEATEARTAEGYSVAGAWGWDPASSPDGRYLALVTTEDPGRTNGSLYVVDTQTAEATLVLEKVPLHPAGWLSE